jgi:DNA repair exonuclease SbcCD ATPase subunit
MSPLKGVMNALSPRMRLQLADQRRNLGLSPKSPNSATPSAANITPVVIKELKSKSSMLQEKQVALKDKTSKVEELQRRLAALDSTAGSFQPMSLFSLNFDSDNERLFAELAATQRELDAARKEVFQDEKSIVTLTNRIDYDWKNIRERLMTSAQEFKKRDDEIRALNAKVEASELLIRSLEDQVGELSEELDARKDQEDDDAETMNDAAALLAAVDAERTALQARLDQIESSGKSYEDIERENEHLRALNAAKTETETITLLKKQLSESEDVRRKVEQQLDDFEVAVHDIEKNGR